MSSGRNGSGRIRRGPSDVAAEQPLRVDAVLTDSDDLVRARSEIDGLAAILESHFRWEERAIVAALDGLQEPGLTAEQLFGG